MNLIQLSKVKQISIPGYITINDSLTPIGFYENIQIPLSIHHLSDIREIDKIISDVSQYTKDCVEKSINEVNANIESAISNMETSNNTLEKYSELLPQLNFYCANLRILLFLKVEEGTM